MADRDFGVVAFGLAAVWAERAARLAEGLEMAQGIAAPELERTRSESMQYALRRAREAAAGDGPVLITGEPGTGKSVLAAAIHRWSRRRRGPLVVVVCRGRSEAEVIDELVGRPGGAFAAPGQARRGRLALAAGGTVILDDLEHAGPRLAALLASDARVVATAAAPLGDGWAWQLALPPLRDRLDDLPALAADAGVELSPAELAIARARRWPGNVTELRAWLCHRGQRASTDTPAPPANDALVTLEEMERAHIRRVLEHTGGKLYGARGAAEILGMKPTTLQSRMRKLGITRTG